MQLIRDTTTLRQTIEAWRYQGERIALVPTMGNLHRGHLRLVEEAQRQAARVVVSIYVNPLQFGANEDFAAYPRTLDQDRTALESGGTALLFLPDNAVMYPNGLAASTQVAVPGLSDILCGAHRPGHFVGVTTVVAKFFNMVRPDVAVFGKKDFQQFILIKKMAQDLAMPIDILGVETERAANGLALSSRNGYLSNAEREQAAGIYRTLTAIAAQIRGGATDVAPLEQRGRELLLEQGFRPDYVTLRRADDLGEPSAEDSAWVLLTAAWLGSTRLIDNIVITRR